MIFISFLNLTSFISFSPLTALDKTASEMLKKMDAVGILDFLISRGKACNILPLIMVATDNLYESMEISFCS